jgi:hypothetical protein
LLLLTILVCFVNPNGITGALYPLHIFSNYGMEVSENGPVSFFLRTSPMAENYNAFAFFAAIAFLVLSYIWSYKQKSVFYFLATTATAIMTFRIIRNMPLFALVFLPAVSLAANLFINDVKYWTRNKPQLLKNLKYLFGVVFVVSFVFCTHIALSSKYNPYLKRGVGITDGSQRAIQFLKENDIKGPIFNDYDIGSYLISGLYPKEKVFFDNRPEAYSEEFIQNTYLPILKDEERWWKALLDYDFNAIVFYRYDKESSVPGFFARRISDPQWALVYADQYAIVFLRRNEKNSVIIDSYEITATNAETRFKSLYESNDYDEVVAAADNLNIVGRNDLGRKVFFEVVSRWPNRGKIWMVMGEWEYLNNASDLKSNLLALMYFDKALEQGYKTDEVYSFLGGTYLRLGYKDLAKKYLNKSLQINSEREDAQSLLESIDVN